ncbi:MAG TPA: Fur family transcriptional regulator [Planctomycetota bacterium]|jgi:Fur family ferric uptake transcriptional regulator|nr:Fur family transcriptional regulator [Planctomycetota bacterium]
MAAIGTDWGEYALAELRRTGHRAGGARTAVVELLARQHCCLTAQEIFDQLRSDGRRVGIASVYRALDLLAGMKLVQRVEMGEGIARFEPMHSGGEHHHHVVCERCGRVAAFEDDQLEEAVAGLAERLGYELGGHDVVLRGECPDCLERPARD